MPNTPRTRSGSTSARPILNNAGRNAANPSASRTTEMASRSSTTTSGGTSCFMVQRASVAEVPHTTVAAITHRNPVRSGAAAGAGDSVTAALEARGLVPRVHGLDHGRELLCDDLPPHLERGREVALVLPELALDEGKALDLLEARQAGRDLGDLAREQVVDRGVVHEVGVGDERDAFVARVGLRLREVRHVESVHV